MIVSTESWKKEWNALKTNLVWVVLAMDAVDVADLEVMDVFGFAVAVFDSMHLDGCCLDQWYSSPDYAVASFDDC